MIKELEQVNVMIKARYPIIYIVSSEEARVINLLKHLGKEEKKKYVWSETSGFRDVEDYDQIGDEPSFPLEALRFINDNKENALFILSDFHSFMNEMDHDVIRLLKELSVVLKRSRKTVIILSSILRIPPELEKEITVVDFPLPNQEEIEVIFDKIHFKMINQKKLELHLTEEQKEQFIKTLMGLTQNEIENVLYKSLVEKKKYSLDVIIQEKEQIIRKTGILEYFHSQERIEHVGGLSYLKSWIIKRKYAFQDKAREFGLPYPKGLLLIGIQGCGKSLSCKAIANIWNFPLLRLDVGAIFQGIVGSSENNIRKAIKLAESISPCILWVDEIEKGFAGVQSSSFSDAGTTARVFGTFLTWMQEKIAPVFVVATANNVNILPPEFLRKGRFDEIFFIDLPNKKERREIFDIHLTRRNRDTSSFNLDTLVEKSNKFSGAEIESAIISALFDAYEEKLNNRNTDLKTHHILKSLEKLVPLSTFMKDEIEKMRKWASKRTRPASEPELFSKDRSYELEL
ncbi:MAG: AAA family ATPase [Promethearchaeota archaeon]